MKLPVENTIVYLPSPGVNERYSTLHEYSHSELVTIKRDGASVTGLGHFYRCTETKELRRWGFDVTYAKDDGAN
jgi:hypothetical protein